MRVAAMSAKHRFSPGSKTRAPEETPEEEQDYILGLDYSRICCLLWGVCKNQELKLQQQERRLKALEKIINK